MGQYLVTGGAGFIGGHFVELAIEAGHSVVTLDALTYAGNRANLSSVEGNPKHSFVHGSINDGELIRRLLAKHRPSAVINFAAESHVDRSIDGPDAFVKTNINGTFELIKACREYWSDHLGGASDGFRLLHVSTDEVYGSIETGKFTEASRYAPNSPYAASKAAADHLVRAFHVTYGLPIIITNCGNNYGTRQFPEKLIPHMVLSALNGAPLPVYGDGLQVRNWLYVDDHCNALLRVLAGGRSGETYLIGGFSEESNIDVIGAICEILDRKCPRSDGRPYRNQITHVADRPGHDRRYAMDASKLTRDLGWRPLIDFRSGLTRTVDWYLANKDWCDHVKSGGYRLARIGLGETKESAT
jgi:dTDP-glucose 4,6-dehydratase